MSVAHHNLPTQPPMLKPTPLRIDWQLSGHVVVPDRHPIMLDALLLSAQGDRHTLPFPHAALPLQHINTASGFFWLASAIEIDFVGPASYRQTFRNARPLQMLKDAKHLHASSVSLERGITRTVKSTHMTRQATAARAWCMGTMEALSELLARVSHLGAKRHTASGEITGWQITADDAAQSQAWLRPIPEEHHSDPFQNQRIAMQGPCMPPYWHKRPACALWPSQICL